MVGYLDMDGVIADFMRGALARHGRLDVLDDYPRGVWAVEQHLGITSDEFWDPLRGHDFWSSLDKYPWFDQMIELMNDTFGDQWFICSTPCDDPYSASGKLEWLNRDLPLCNGRSFRRFFLGVNKEQLAKPGAILIDDNDRNCWNFSNARGASVLVPQMWNSRHDRVGCLMDDVQSQLRIMQNNIESWEELAS